MVVKKSKKKLKFNFKKAVNKIGKFLYGLVFVFLLLVAVLVTASTFKIPGNFKLYVVKSGSMEPSIKTGSVVVIKPESDYKKGDVITVKGKLATDETFTHRIHEVKDMDGQVSYITKGDANDAPDMDERVKGDVLGKVLFSVPHLGYPVGYAKTRDGLIFLIIVPATLIIYDELITIKNETKRLLEERKKRKLTPKEKLKVEIDKEEIKTEKWIKRLFRRLFRKKK